MARTASGTARRTRLAAPVVRTLAPLLLAAAPMLAQGGGGHGGAGIDLPLPPTSTGIPGQPNVLQDARKQVALSPIPMTLLAVPFPIAGAVDDQVALLVEMNGKELLAGNDGAVEGHIDASIVDGSGAAKDSFTQPFALDVTDERLQHGLKLYGILRVPPGDYKIKVGVTDKAGAKGSGETSLHAPDFGRREAVLSPPLFPEPADRWRVFQQSDSPHEDLPFPFADAQGGGFLPAATPTVGPDGASCVVFAYGAAGDAPRITAKLVANGKTYTPKVTLLESGTGKFTIQRRLLLKIDGPLPEGGGRLELAVQATDAVRTTASALVVEKQAEAQPQLAAQSGDEPQEANPEDEPAALPQGFTKEDVGARYRDVLQRAERGEIDAAVRQLADLETAATTHRHYGENKALREVERATIDGEHLSLLNVAYVHVRLDDELARRGAAWNVAQNRLWLADLMERFVKTSAEPGRLPDGASRIDAPQAKHLAAQLLAGVGNNQEAIAYEPTNELALLRLAISAEKVGDLEGASNWLKKLLDAHPGNAHARIRLAVIDRRKHDDAGAARLLEGLMNEGSAPSSSVPRWIAGLACQQLAEIQRARGNEAMAETVLRQGIDKLGIQALYVQLAFYLDERQKADEAVQVLNGMPVISGPDELSGRFLYNEPPRAEMAIARQQIEASVIGAWPQLRAGLQAHGTQVGGRR